jgi:hypothetical protein
MQHGWYNGYNVTVQRKGNAVYGSRSKANDMMTEGTEDGVRHTVNASASRTSGIAFTQKLGHGMLTLVKVLVKKSLLLPLFSPPFPA